MSPGRLFYLLWHAPRATLARSRREGGLLQQMITRRGQREMEAAAALLPPRSIPNSASTEVTFLTGKRFWYQTLFCCWSLSQQSQREFTPVFIDDGSFDPELRGELLRMFPSARILNREDRETALVQNLPVKKFPTLRAQRLTYLHLRKITDAHVGHRGWRLVLDSDMLFFRRPAELLRWLDAPTQPIHMLDVQDAYGYPGTTLTTLAGRPVPAKINVGICGLRSETIDWEKLEYWARQLLERHGTSYYLEQALIALLLSDAAPIRLPASDYRLLPDDAECLAPTAAMHHYVDLSKRGYFRHAWRHVMASAAAS